MDADENRPQGSTLSGSDDYLWTGSANPDPEVQRLETLLAKFRHNRRTPGFPEIVPQRAWGLLPRRLQFGLMVSTATAMAIIAIVFLALRNHSTPVTVEGWDVSLVAGTPHVGQTPVRVKQIRQLRVGQVLETDLQSRASLRAESVGQIEVEPSTRLRLLTMAPGLKRIALDRGTIHAYIWAPPGQFVVDTPSALTVDLGCAYTLHVDDTGAGVVRTSLGWVGFKLNGHESFIPAGAACMTRPKVGPGTPYFEDASEKLRTALEQFDFEDRTPQQRATDLATVLIESRKRDALTLWHLLSRADEGQRIAVYDRLGELVPPPATVTREGIMRLDKAMLDQWWNELGFDDIALWRHWERNWSGGIRSQPK